MARRIAMKAEIRATAIIASAPSRRVKNRFIGSPLHSLIILAGISGRSNPMRGDRDRACRRSWVSWVTQHEEDHHRCDDDAEDHENVQPAGTLRFVLLNRLVRTWARGAHTVLRCHCRNRRGLTAPGEVEGAQPSLKSPRHVSLLVGYCNS